MSRQRRAHRQFAEPNDVVSPRGRRVQHKRNDDDHIYNDTRPSLCAELVLP